MTRRMVATICSHRCKVGRAYQHAGPTSIRIVLFRQTTGTLRCLQSWSHAAQERLLGAIASRLGHHHLAIGTTIRLAFAPTRARFSFVVTSSDILISSASDPVSIGGPRAPLIDVRRDGLRLQVRGRGCRVAWQTPSLGVLSDKTNTILRALID